VTGNTMIYEYFPNNPCFGRLGRHFRVKVGANRTELNQDNAFIADGENSVITHLTLVAHGREVSLPFAFTRMFNAGYVGRNQQEVRRHVRELAAKGIPAPSSTPALYAVACQSLNTANEIDVYGSETSGEAEYVLLVENANTVYVGLGSDHTDRLLEKTDIPRSKQICPNVIAPLVWKLDEVAGHWDELVLRSYVVKDGNEMLYQEGTLGAIFSPDQLMEFISERTGTSLDSCVLFSGTLSLKTGDFVYGQMFRTELVDPRLNRKLELSYSIRELFSLNPGGD
jgi:hypothetical protein